MVNKMKILQINAVYNISSTGRIVTELHSALLEKEIDSFVAYSKTNKLDDANLYQIGSLFDTKLHALLSRITGKQGYFSNFATKRLLKYIDSINPDVIHLGNLHGNFINLPMLLNYIAENDIPTVITLHDCWFFTGKCCHYTADNCWKWQTQCDKCPIIEKYNKSWFFDRTQRMFDDKKELFGKINNLAVIGVSDWLTNDAKKAPVFEKAKLIRRIYNWIDLNIFYPRETDELRKELNLSGEFVLMSVSHKWCAEKGLIKVVDLARKMPHIKFVLVGRIVDEIDLPSNIISVGEVKSAEKMAEYYSIADAMLYLSIQETFGKVTAESIASGTPVIGYNSTATPELIGNGCGKVLELDATNDEIAQAIEEIRENGKEKYFSNCVEFAKNNFDKDKLIGDFIDLYKEMIEKK